MASPYEPYLFFPHNTDLSLGMVGTQSVVCWYLSWMLNHNSLTLLVLRRKDDLLPHKHSAWGKSHFAPSQITSRLESGFCAFLRGIFNINRVIF
ncbi:hypothetical protein I7I48_01240 [Histoplasma ohiense]|nr:hypothetical protein I7I48_01240 [Histoplasma ohiense (nom. inval.)]